MSESLSPLGHMSCVEVKTEGFVFFMKSSYKLRVSLNDSTQFGLGLRTSGLDLRTFYTFPRSPKRCRVNFVS